MHSHVRAAAGRALPRLLAAILCLGALRAQEQKPDMQGVDDWDQRKRPAPWGKEAPGDEVVDVRLMPLERVPYSVPSRLHNPVGDDELVIGCVVDGKAVAFPVKMLGGPHREIVNAKAGASLFAASW
ncbi:MAG TPA: hypothetical protein ENK43_05960 [Planctomycetes bacterium]|nr:hypothetical protein [Planctomycetota bacterium]